MKAIKALKRLTKAEALLSNVIERFVASGHSIQEVLQDAKASVIRAKDAVGLQASPRKSKRPSVKAGRLKRRRLAAVKGTTESPSHVTPKPPKPGAATKRHRRLQKPEAGKAKPVATKKTVSKKGARKKAVAKKVAKTLMNTVAKKSAPTKKAAVKTAPASSQATTGAAAP